MSETLCSCRIAIAQKGAVLVAVMWLKHPVSPKDRLYRHSTWGKLHLLAEPYMNGLYQGFTYK